MQPFDSAHDPTTGELVPPPPRKGRGGIRGVRSAIRDRIGVSRLKKLGITMDDLVRGVIKTAGPRLLPPAGPREATGGARGEAEEPGVEARKGKAERGDGSQSSSRQAGEESGRTEKNTRRRQSSKPRPEFVKLAELAIWRVLSSIRIKGMSLPKDLVDQIAVTMAEPVAQWLWDLGYRFKAGDDAEPAPGVA